MADQNARQAAAEGNAPQDTATDAQPQDTGAAEGNAPQDAAAGEGKQTNPNVHKLERDVANRDKRIAELERALFERA